MREKKSSVKGKVIKQYRLGEYDVVFVETVNDKITDMQHIHLNEWQRNRSDKKRDQELERKAIFKRNDEEEKSSKTA